MKKVTYMTTIAGVVLLAGLAGCSGQPEVQSPAPVPDQGSVSPGKATAAVSMTHRFSATPAVGQPIELELVFAADQAASRDGTIELQIHGDQELAVIAHSGRRISHGERVVVDLVPQAEGRFYVNVIARLGSGNRARAKVFSIPVQVGTKAFESTAQKATIGPDGERLIRMPAEEKPD